MKISKEQTYQWPDDDRTVQHGKSDQLCTADTNKYGKCYKKCV